MKPQQTISIIKVIRLLTKAVKYGRDGFSKEELKELGTDLLTLGLEILEDIESK